MNEIDIMQQFGNMGIGGILLFMVVKEWLIFQKRKADGFSYSDMAKKLEQIDKRTEFTVREIERIEPKVEKLFKESTDSWTWHSATDSSGVFRWWNKQSFEDVLKELTKAIQEQTKVFSEVILVIKNTNDEVRRMDSELRDIRRKS